MFLLLCPILAFGQVNDTTRIGDLNLNYIKYEISDAVLFSYYFVYGEGVFTVNLDAQIATSDINLNDTPLEVADFQLMTNIIIGASPIPQNPDLREPIRTFFYHEYGVLSTETELGSLYIIVAGDISPQLLVSNVEMKYNFDGENTKILIFSFDNESFSDDIIDFAGEIIYIEGATPNGARVVKFKKGTLPDIYLHQNYPNPFNPTTSFTISSAVEKSVFLDIYNLTGQLVDRLQINLTPGIHEVEWNGSKYSSGIYYYTIPGVTRQPKKMVLLK